MAKLGVNIDHVASVREIRRGLAPEPVTAALLAEEAGADSIVAHLREDRRHIKEKDILNLRKRIKTKLNLEMSIAPDIVNFACRIKPNQATLVPEKRKEITTEGGLDAAGDYLRVKKTVSRLQKKGIEVSLFIDPEKKQIDAAKKLGVRMIELHTGRFADAKNGKQQKMFLREISAAVKYGLNNGLTVNAGHGLDYHNVKKVAAIAGIEEFNIGYSIVCRAVIIGIKQAVLEMKKLIGH